MTTARLALTLCSLLAAVGAGSAAASTTYTLPAQIHWVPETGKGVPPGAYHALLRGKDGDKCGQLYRRRWPNGFVYPWHANGVYGIYTVLQGTLVVQFDKQHPKSGERVLTAGSVMQGLTNEPHYTRAIGETVFDVYVPCSTAQ